MAVKKSISKDGLASKRKTRKSTRLKLRRKAKAYWGRVRRIAEIEGIPIAAARERAGKTIVDVVLVDPTTRVYQSYIEDRETKLWYPIEPGKTRQMKHAIKTRAFTKKDILRKVKRAKYESGVRSVMEMTGMEYNKARKFLAGFKTWEDGVYYASKEAKVKFAPPKRRKPYGYSESPGRW